MFMPVWKIFHLHPNILDCTVCGLTDGHQVLLMHICPTNPKNKSFNLIERFIKDRICLDDSNLQGFILGSKLNNPETPLSEELFEKFVKFMKDYKIPFSVEVSDLDELVW